MEKDDSLINEISSGDSIIVYNELPNDCIYNNPILKKNKNSSIISINFVILNKHKKVKYTMFFPCNITIKEMIEEFFNINNTPSFIREKIMFSNAFGIVNKYDNCLISSKFKNNSDLKLLDLDYNFSLNLINGKPLIATVKNENEEIIYDFSVGSLQLLKDIYRCLQLHLKNYLNLEFIENPIIYPGEIELKPLDERTLSSIGIINNFIFKVNF